MAGDPVAQHGRQRPRPALRQRSRREAPPRGPDDLPQIVPTPMQTNGWMRAGSVQRFFNDVQRKSNDRARGPASCWRHEPSIVCAMWQAPETGCLGGSADSGASGARGRAQPRRGQPGAEPSAGDLAAGCREVLPWQGPERLRVAIQLALLGRAPADARGYRVGIKQAAGSSCAGFRRLGSARRPCFS